MKTFFVLILVLCLANTSSADQQIQFVSNVDVAPDGSQLTFDWNGDIWLAPIQGGRQSHLPETRHAIALPVFHPMANHSHSFLIGMGPIKYTRCL